MGNKETKTNCTIEIYGQPYNEICDETKLADISVSPFGQYKALKEMEFDKEYGEVLVAV